MRAITGINGCLSKGAEEVGHLMEESDQEPEVAVSPPISL